MATEDEAENKQFTQQNPSRHIFCHHICRMIENWKKNFPVITQILLKNKKQLSLELERCLIDSFRPSSISLLPELRRIVLYLCMYRRHPFTSRDILRPKVAEQMPLRQQQARGPRRFQLGLHVISALTGERRAGPSQLRPLPLGRQRGGARAAAPKVFGQN